MKTGPRWRSYGVGSRRSPTSARSSGTSTRQSEKDRVGRIIGIDLGTTNSLVAVLEEGGPRVLSDPESRAALLPSAVAFLPGGEVVIGQRAKDLAAERPFDTVLSVKRFMGLGVEHLSAEDRRRYRFVDGPAGVSEVIR